MNYYKLGIIKHLIFLCFFYSCLHAAPQTSFSEARHKIIHRVLRNFNRAMQTKGFRAAGIGEGLDHSTGKQNYLAVTFDIDQLPDVNFARRVVVETIEEFLHYINSQDGIQDYLAEYPFPIRFIRICFISRCPNKGLFSVSNFRDELSYDQENHANPISPSIEVHRESYAEAIRILTEQKNVKLAT